MSETYLSLLRFPGDRAVIKIYMAAGEWKILLVLFSFLILLRVGGVHAIVHVAG